MRRIFVIVWWCSTGCTVPAWTPVGLRCDEDHACPTGTFCVEAVCAESPADNDVVDCAFLQSAAGLLALEPEHADVATAGLAHVWGRDSSAGWVGSGAVRAEPNTQTTYDPTELALSPRLDWKVRFSRAGTHYVWARMMAARGTDDSLHVGIDDGGIMAMDIDGIALSSSGWAWTRNTLDAPIATLMVPTTGEHTLSMWMREDGAQVDRLLVTSDAGFTPSGDGPPESLRPSGCARHRLAYALVDELETSIDPVRWQTAADPGTSIAWGLRGVTLSTPSAAPGDAHLTSVEAFDLRHAAVHVRLVDAGGAAVNGRSTRAYVRVRSGNDYTVLGVTGGMLEARHELGGDPDVIETASFDADAMRYLRLREADGTVYYEYSDTADSWTPFTEAAAPFALGAVTVEVGGGNSATAPASTIVFDDINAANDGYHGTSIATGSSLTSDGDELTALIAGGADTHDTAYARRDFAPVGGATGRLYLRTVFRQPAGEPLTDSLRPLVLRDADDLTILSIFVEADRSIWLHAVAGALQGPQTDANLGALPIDGSAVRLEIFYERGQTFILRLDDAELVRLTSSTSTRANPSALLYGIIDYGGTSTTEPIHILHRKVGVSTTGWLGP
jgi:hypothetical protein